MAGDGGRAPDVSEQRAEVESLPPEHPAIRAGADAVQEEFDERGFGDSELLVSVIVEAALPHLSREIVRFLASDPASVLAALLAEHPDATIAALETLLTTDEAVEAGRQAIHSGNGCTCRRGARGDAHDALAAACRSLRPKAPKEDGDA